jgi:hypothetical protein
MHSLRSMLRVLDNSSTDEVVVTISLKETIVGAIDVGIRNGRLRLATTGAHPWGVAARMPMS